MQESLKALREYSSFVSSGVFYGFPKCCIENFCLNFGFHDSCIVCNKINSGLYNYTTEKKGKYCRDCALKGMVNLKSVIEGNYTGFLPCYKCAVSINMDKSQLKKLLNNRLSKENFPNTNKKDFNFRDIFLMELVTVSTIKNKIKRYNLRKRKRINYYQ